jgi:hypothetical protein
MLRIFRAADGADTALLGEQLLELLLADAVAATEAVLATAAVEPLPDFPCPAVVTGLAVRGIARTVGPVTGKVDHRLDGSTVGAEAMTFRNFPGGPHLSAMLLPDPFGVTGFRTGVEARLTVAATTAGTLAARTELNERLPFPAVAATTTAVLVIQRERHVRFEPICSLTSFLYITPDKFFGVLLQDRVDLVEQVVDVLGDLGVPLGDLGVDLGGDVVDLLGLVRLARLGLAALL